MTQLNYLRQATELADIMRERFEEHKHSQLFTLWDHAFLWTGTTLGKEERIPNPYRALIPEIFERSSQTPVKPDILVPRATSEYTHFSLLALANRDLVEQEYRAALEEVGYQGTEEIMGIINDQRLAQEMLKRFVGLKRSGHLDEKVDLLDFLINYDVKRRKLRKSSRKPRGTYIHLATRLVYRYNEEKLEENIFSLVGEEESEEAKEFHQSATQLSDESIVVDPKVTELYQKHASNDGTELEKPKRRSKIPLKGKRKVRVRGGSISIDWTVLAEERRRRVLTYQAFKPQEVILARVERELTEKYLNIYHNSREDIGAVLAAINIDLAQAGSDEEKRVLGRVKLKYELVGRFDTFNIKHEMPVTRIGGNQND